MELTDGGTFTCHAKADVDGENDLHFNVLVNCELNECHGYAIVLSNAPTTTITATTTSNRLTTQIRTKQNNRSGVGISLLVTTVSPASAISVSSARSSVILSNNNQIITTIQPSAITTSMDTVDKQKKNINFSNRRQLPTTSYYLEKIKRRG